MPDRFVLECLTRDGSWIDFGAFESSLFERGDDGTYVCAGHGGSPIFIRCVRQDGSVIYVLDGRGQPFTYRLVPLSTSGDAEGSRRVAASG